MYLTDLAAACRKSRLPVIEWPGWQTRGHGGLTAVRGIVVHHTATPAAMPGDYPSIRVIRDGRTDLPGPLSQLGLGRTGTVHVIAAGKATHAGAWSWPGTSGNADCVGIEGEAPGVGTGGGWTPEQLSAWPRLLAALALHYDLPVTRIAGHKEGAIPAGRKIDPAGIDMAALRHDTGRIMAPPPAQEDTPMTPQQQQLIETRLQRMENQLAALIAVAERPLDVERRLGARLDELVALLDQPGPDAPAT